MWNQLIGGALVSLLNFGIHAVFTGIIIYATRHTARATSEMVMFARMAALTAVTMITLMVAHVIEISVWAAFYEWGGVTVTAASSFEFAFENYTALGYGDAVPPQGSRLLGPIAALNGLLLIGWSVAIVFEVMRMAEVQFERLPIRGVKRRK